MPISTLQMSLDPKILLLLYNEVIMIEKSG
jgi:hypothetical protein